MATHPYPPRLRTTLYLYDEAKPRIVDVAIYDHVAVEVDEAGFVLAAWTPDTLRRFADACNEAADRLEAALADGTEAA